MSTLCPSSGIKADNTTYEAVLALLLQGGWWTAVQLADRIGAQHNTVVKDINLYLRKEHTIESRPVSGKRQYEYHLVPKNQALQKKEHPMRELLEECRRILKTYPPECGQAEAIRNQIKGLEIKIGQ